MSTREAYYLKETLLQAASKLRAKGSHLYRATLALRKIGASYDSAAVDAELCAIEGATEAIEVHAETIR